jgi:nitroimidazol reductase NimA-like FMN-containing flavoprotein (pyridoxamine 5'-phosphate oxidase superfamily)
MDEGELATTARRIIDENLYMVLGTADDQGVPWVSPVFFAADGYRTFYWVSSPEVTHSQNLTHRSDTSIVVFDSQVVVGGGRTTAVYMAGAAELVPDAEVAHGLTVYPGSPERGVRTMTVEELTGPGPLRLYRASVTRHWMLCPLTGDGPCPTHGLAVEHRTEVAL